MFYSHNFLAKKSPLGTVWIAAHLQHKLRKSHVSVTDISSTVDCIMFPEVPIALRLSGHLLLGVVRIYSRKVNYLFEDCNQVLSHLRTMFASVHVDLAEDADRAPFQAVTSPETFHLDALDMDAMPQEGPPDNHLKTLEQITLPDQNLLEGGSFVAFGCSYVALCIDQDRFDSPPQRTLPNVSAGPMDEDILPQAPEDNSRDADASQGLDGPDRSPYQSSNADQTIDDISPIEVARHHAHNSGQNIAEFDDVSGSNIGSIELSKNNRDGVSPTTRQLLVIGVDADASQDVNDPTKGPHQSSNPDQTLEYISSMERARDTVHKSGGNIRGLDDVLGSNIVELHGSTESSKNNNDGVSPTTRQLSFHEVGSLPILPGKNPTAAGTPEASGGLSPGLPSGGQSAGLRLVPSPLVDKQKRSRKRKWFFDKSLVLTNAEMKNQLEDPSEVAHKRRKLPCSTLDIWRFHKKMRKDQILNELLLSGMCTQLQEVSERVFPTVMNGVSPNATHEMDVEMEQNRCNVMHDQGLPGPMLFPSETVELTSTDPSNPAEPRTGKTPEANKPSRLENCKPAEQPSYTPERLSVNSEDPLPPETTLSPEDPGLHDNSGQDLSFLEAETTPSDNEISEFHGMLSTQKALDDTSQRTWLVAQYLKERSPMTQFSNKEPGCLSLNKILEGKRRKQCARMFYETLVLKDKNFIDVDQEEAYGDISITVIPTPSKPAA